MPKRPANVSKSRGSGDAVTSCGVNSNDVASFEASPINTHNDTRRSKRHQDRQSAKADRNPTLTAKLNMKDEFFSAEGQVNKSRSGLPRTIAVEKQTHGKPPELKTSLKRALSEVVPVTNGLASASCSQFPLIPPSPTPENASSNHRVPLNGKGKAGTSRKKAKVVGEEDEDEDEDDLDDVAVKVINRAQTTQRVS